MPPQTTARSSAPVRATRLYWLPSPARRTSSPSVPASVLPCGRSETAEPTSAYAPRERSWPAAQQAPKLASRSGGAIARPAQGQEPARLAAFLPPLTQAARWHGAGAQALTFKDQVVLGVDVGLGHVARQLPGLRRTPARGAPSGCGLLCVRAVPADCVGTPPPRATGLSGRASEEPSSLHARLPDPAGTPTCSMSQRR